VQGRVKRRKEEKQDERETRPHGFVVIKLDLRSGIVVRGQDRAQGAGGEWNIFEHITRNE
jgi:hypothetical protein